MTLRAWREPPTCFGCEGETLVGVLCEPAAAADSRAVGTGTGVVIVVGGPQYRAGAHRMFVQLARGLAAGGHVALRFDVRGMGDSTGEPGGFEHQSADIDAAVSELLRRCPGLARVVLWGLCDGASASLLYLQSGAGARVHGLCIVNPWVRTEALQARTQIRHYYLQRLLQPAFWRKLLAGGVGLAALQGLGASVRRSAGARAADTRPYVQRMLDGLLGHRGPLLLVQSGNDYTAREFDELLRSDSAWRAAMSAPGVQRVDVAEADHTFSNAGAMDSMLEATLAWLGAAAGPARSDAGPARDLEVLT